MKKVWLGFGGVAVAVVSVLVACVGDDVAGDRPADADGGVDGSSSSSSGGPDATTPNDAGADADAVAPTKSCRGLPFDEIKQVDTAQIAAAVDSAVVWGPRFAETAAQSSSDVYFAAWPAGATEQQIFRATFVAASAGGAPLLKNATLLAPPSSVSSVEWTPAVALNGNSPPTPAYMIFSVGFPSRDLALATASGGGFNAATTIAALTTARDEADPWLVGRPPTAVYFAQEQDESPPRHVRIFRAPITGGATPAFGAPAPFTATCPDFHCGTPVTSADEKIVLFSAWPDSPFAPTVNEVIQGADGGAATMKHDELGAAYPSWISGDGCEVLLGGGGPPTYLSTLSQIRWARRTAK